MNFGTSPPTPLYLRFPAAQIYKFQCCFYKFYLKNKDAFCNLHDTFLQVEKNTVIPGKIKATGDFYEAEDQRKTEYRICRPMITGLIFTLLIGIFWSLVGVYYRAIAKWKLSFFDISLVTGVSSMIFLLACITDTGALLHGEITAPSCFFILFVLAGGAVNMLGGLFLQRSMVWGKSSVTWAIGQSALIIPFTAITLIFHEPWSILKISGTIAVVAGMLLLSMRPGGTAEAPRPRYGVLLALTAFCLLGIGQTILSAQSFSGYDDAAGIRAPLQVAGSFLAVLTAKFAMHDRGFKLNRKVLLLLLLMTLQGVLTTVLQFYALDALKECGMNGVFFPVAVGTCIAGYSVWSVAIYKEHLSLPVIAGTLTILAGIAAYCLTAAG